MDDVNLWLIVVAGVGMVLVAGGAVAGWKRISHTGWKWFWIGGGLWIVAVAIKVAVALAINERVTS